MLDDPPNKYRLSFLIFLAVVSIVIASNKIVDTVVKANDSDFTAPSSTLVLHQSLLYNEALDKGLTYFDFRRMKAIVQCESRWNHYDKKGKVLKSYSGTPDYGYGQINIPSWGKEVKAKGFDIMKPDDNIKAVVYIYKKEGKQPWGASADCQRKELAKVAKSK